MKILFEIMEKRREMIKAMGYTQGEEIPDKRTVPLNQFLNSPSIICEVKRKSPSKPNINTGLNPVETAESYINKGISHLSVLTEPNYFGGSLSDLIQIKNAFPEACVLRKDFILDTNDMDIAYRAGADAVLLIAAVHSVEKLQALYKHAEKLGLSVLFEVHNRDELKKAEIIKPKILGINTRDLKTFSIDPIIPLQLKKYISWDCVLVFESGIHSRQQAAFAASLGASALLVGESVVKDSTLINDISKGFTSPLKDNFWSKLLTHKKKGPLVKICGITNEKDMLAADELGADCIGFIFADSPRQISPENAGSFGSTNALKVGVCVLGNNEEIHPEIIKLLENNKLQALQIHGSVNQNYLKTLPYPVYETISVKDSSGLKQAKSSFYPRVLLDAFSPGLHGGTGKQINKEILETAGKTQALWIAGGLNPNNVYDVINNHKPELIDASSGLEASPGIKDHNLLQKYFTQIKSAMEQNNELV